MIPLLFGVQQIIERMLWLSFRFDDLLLTAITTYAFSLFSHVLWPICTGFDLASGDRPMAKKGDRRLPGYRPGDRVIPVVLYRAVSGYR